jgi:DNA-binding GntR family transcriptional regulator
MASEPQTPWSIPPVRDNGPMPLRDRVAMTIRELIIAGHARPGELLRLAPLAAQLDISITPVREALLLLTQDGWLKQELNRGFRVSPIRRDDVRDNYFVLGLLSGELTARAAQRALPAQIRQLRDLDARIKGLSEDDDMHAEVLNYDVHHAIYDIAESPRLVWFVTAATRFVPRQFWGTIPGWRALNEAGHSRIIDLIERGDAAAARTAMTEHIHLAEELLLNRLDNLSFWDGAEGKEVGDEGAAGDEGDP